MPPDQSAARRSRSRRGSRQARDRWSRPSGQRGTGAAPDAISETPGRRRRSLGQNFFRSADDARRFASQLKGRGDAIVVEVGAGSGMITRAFAERGTPVVALEVDPYWALRLDKARLPGVTVVQDDFLRWTPPPGRLEIIGNLPFGAGTQILRHCLELGPERLDQAVLLLQEEVVRKRAGRWGGNLFNVQWAPWYELAAGAAFSRYAFRPVPDADTATLLIEPREPALLPWGEWHAFQELARSVFSTGHLTLEAASRGVVKRGWKTWLGRSGLDGERHVKDLTADEWLALYLTSADRSADSRGGRTGRLCDHVRTGSAPRHTRSGRRP